MISRLLASAPAIGAPLDEWQAWARKLDSDALDVLSEAAAAAAMQDCAESTRARVREWCERLPAPMVQCLLLRGVRDRERDPPPPAAWAWVRSW